MKSFEPALSTATFKNVQPAESRIERSFTRESTVTAYKNAAEVVRKSDATEKELVQAMADLHKQLPFSLQEGNFTELFIGANRAAMQSAVLVNGREIARRHGVTYDKRFDPFEFVPLEKYENHRLGEEGEVRDGAGAHYDIATGEIVVSPRTYDFRQLFYPLPTLEYPAALSHENQHRSNWSKYIEPFLRVEKSEDSDKEVKVVESAAQGAKAAATTDIVSSEEFFKTHKMVPPLLMWTDEILAYTVDVQVRGSRSFAEQIEMMKDSEKYCVKFAPPGEIVEKIVVTLASALEMGMHPDEVMRTLVEDIYGQYKHLTDEERNPLEMTQFLDEFIAKVASFGLASGALDLHDAILPDQKLTELAKKYYIRAQIKADIATASSHLALADLYDRAGIRNVEMVRSIPDESADDTSYYLRLSREPTNLGINEYQPHVMLRPEYTGPAISALPLPREYEISFIGRNRITGANESLKKQSSYGFTEKDAPKLAEKLFNSMQDMEKKMLVARCNGTLTFISTPANLLDYHIGNEFMSLLEKSGYISTVDKDRYLLEREAEHRLLRNDAEIGSLRMQVNQMATEAEKRDIPVVSEVTRKESDNIKAIGVFSSYFTPRTNSRTGSLVRLFIPKPATVEESRSKPGIDKIGDVRLEFVRLTEDEYLPIISAVNPATIATEEVAYKIIAALTEQEEERLALAFRENRIVTDQREIAIKLGTMLSQAGYVVEANAPREWIVQQAIKRRISKILAHILL